jgi:hypothetical protein
MLFVLRAAGDAVSSSMSVSRAGNEPEGAPTANPKP